MKAALGYSAIGGRLDGKVIAVTMFAGRLLAATDSGIFILSEQGEWLPLKPTFDQPKGD